MDRPILVPEALAVLLPQLRALSPVGTPRILQGPVPFVVHAQRARDRAPDLSLAVASSTHHRPPPVCDRRAVGLCLRRSPNPERERRSPGEECARSAGCASAPAWAVAILAACLLPWSTGCHSTQGPRDGKVQVLRPGQRLDTRRLELTSEDERRVEAHARFAAGMVEEFAEAPEAALAHYLAALEADPGHEGLALDVGRKLIELRRYEEARKILERATAREDASGLAWGMLGVAHAYQEHPAQAQSAQREAIRRTPKSVAAYRELAHLYIESGRLGEAVAVLEEAALQADTPPRFLLSLAEILGGLQQVKESGLGDLKERILRLLDRAAELHPTEPSEVLRLADLLERFGAGSKALPLYQGLLEAHPDLPGLRERLADVYLRTDDKEKAAEQLRVLAQRQPTNPLPHYYLGILALEARQYDDAVSAFNRVLILRPDNEAIHHDLALAHISHNQPAEALLVLDKARTKFRASFRLEFFSAVAMSMLKRYEESIRHFVAAEVIAGATAPEQLTYLFYFQSGVALERAKRFDDAAVQFEKAVELKPDFGEALNYLGYMWAERGTNLERARELIQRAVDLEPDNGAFLDSLAWVLHQLGRSEEALPLQLKAIEKSEEPDVTLEDHLGDIYFKLGRLEEARKAWERAQALEAKPEIEKKLKDLPPQ